MGKLGGWLIFGVGVVVVLAIVSRVTVLRNLVLNAA